MILCILDTKTIRKTIKIYIVVTVISIIFSYIYEMFSYGEYSNYMRFLFVVPIIGEITYEIIYLLKINITRATYNLFNSGIAILMSGMLIKGIINISGRYTNYDIIYWILGTIFILSAIIIQIKYKKLKNRLEK